MSDAIEAQVRDYLHSADGRLFALQQRAIAATNARPSPANFVNAIVSDTIFPKKSTMGPVKLGQKGVVKYGRHGEYLLHIGVDEDVSLFNLISRSSLTDSSSHLSHPSTSETPRGRSSRPRPSLLLVRPRVLPVSPTPSELLRTPRSSCRRKETSSTPGLGNSRGENRGKRDGGPRLSMFKRESCCYHRRMNGNLRS
jgi:hypothetical protein